MIYLLKEWESAKRGYKFGEKTFYSPNHLGVDHIVPVGTKIYAPVDCEIIFSQCGKQGGNTIWLSIQDGDFGNLIIRCMHLKELTPKGKYKEGDVVGYTGNTGEYTKGAHLHTDISKGSVKITNFNNFIDPEKYFIERVKCENNECSITTYKKDNEPVIYILVGNILIPFATSFEVYQKDFKNAKIITLSEFEFNKYIVSSSVKITQV